MHEASIAQHIIEELSSRIADGTLPQNIERVHLNIGKFSAVVPDNLSFMFEVLSRDSTLEGVALVIEEIAIRCRCNNCQLEFPVEEMNFWCRECGSPEVSIIAGRELLIDSVEVEDADEKN